MVLPRIVVILAMIWAINACKGSSGSKNEEENAAATDDSTELTLKEQFVNICQDESHEEYKVANFFRQELQVRNGGLDFSCEQTFDYYNTSSTILSVEPVFVVINALDPSLENLFVALGEEGFSDLSILRFFGNLELMQILVPDQFDWESIGLLENLQRILIVESPSFTSIPESWENLTNLSTLEIQAPSLEDIGNISKIPSLTGLALISTAVTDFSPIGSNATLQVMQFADNGIESIPESWKDLDALQLLIIASEPSLTDASNLTEMESLLQLEIEDTAIADFTPIAGNTNLASLTLINSGITSIPAGLSNLQVLQVIEDKLTDITNIESATNLLAVELSGNTIPEASLTVFGGLTSLIQLVIGDTGIEGDINNPGITAIPAEWQNLSALEILYIHTEQTLDMTNAALLSSANMAGLFLLDVGLTVLTDITALDNLQLLDVSSNSGLDLNLLPLPTSLNSLVINESALTAIPVEVSLLTNLSLFYAADNNLTSVAPLAGNVNLKEIDPFGNPGVDFTGNNIVMDEESCPTTGASAAITAFCS